MLKCKAAFLITSYLQVLDVGPITAHFGFDRMNRTAIPVENAKAIIALNHHEKWDGSGYPGHVDPLTGKLIDGHNAPRNGPQPGKKGEAIPLFGRIVAIADVFDALSSKRSYKEPWDEARSIEIISRGAGIHFAFIRAIQARYAEPETEPKPDDESLPQ